MRTAKTLLSLMCWVLSSQLLLAAAPRHVVGWGGISLPSAPGSVFTNIGAGTNNSLALANVSLGNAGQYTCIVSNALGAVTNFVTLNVVNHPPIQFDGTLSQLANDGFHLRLTGLTGHGSAVIYASTNLMNWEGIYTNPPSFGPLDFVDVAATNSTRFYRAAEGL